MEDVLNNAKRNEKHAFLIMAHKDDKTFRTLLRLLDDSRNDIFVHMDIKNKDWNEDVLKSLFRFSSCYAIPRINVVWGGVSEVVCELNLLEAATVQGHYSFYHLLSGADLPIKSQDVIHEFFDNHMGVEFVRYVSQPIDCVSRVYGHRLWTWFGRDRNQKILHRLDSYLSHIDVSLFHRSDDFAYQKGDQWFSIGDDFARYVLSKKSWILNKFRYSYCADEVFLQSILWNSPFKNNVYRQNGEDNWDAIQRLIDWKRGFPYCYEFDDFDLLKQSPLLFARKFDCSKDEQIIRAIETLCF